MASTSAHIYRDGQHQRSNPALRTPADAWRPHHARGRENRGPRAARSRRHLEPLHGAARDRERDAARADERARRQREQRREQQRGEEERQPPGAAAGEVEQSERHDDEEVARAMVEGFGGVITKMTPEQAKYIGVPVEGPYKPESYKY